MGTQAGTQAQSIGYRLWMWSAQGLPADPVTKGMVWWTASTQLPDGHWQAQNIRTPLEDGEHQATALGIRALAMFPLEGRESEFAERIQRGATWLAQSPARKHTQEAFRLLGLAWANADSSLLRNGIEGLLNAQKPDGGWAQLKNLESDAWATGLALLALHAAGLETTATAYRHGLEFLLSTQFDDGSWFVKSRSIPVVLPHFDTRFPFGWDQWISAAGTAVASASLALALDPADVQLFATSVVEGPDAEKAEPAFVFQGQRTVDFQKDIGPLLNESCVDCHSGKEPKGNFSMTNRTSLLNGGESGMPPFVPGHGADSQLIRHVTDQVEDMEMPPLKKRKTYPALTPAQVKTLITWIDEGAEWPEGVPLESK